MKIGEDEAEHHAHIAFEPHLDEISTVLQHAAEVSSMHGSMKIRHEASQLWVTFLWVCCHTVLPAFHINAELATSALCAV